ncbi:MAG: hypothetical protein Q8903_12930 [Bacteroidota bacterium]|nr:hypothetical protein [Bacteroidota bacterium]
MLIKLKQNVVILFTVPIVLLMAACSGIGVLNSEIYSRETDHWLIECIGQDLTNLIIIIPILIVSALFAVKGSKIAKIIWAGTMIANIYSYAIYCFAVHFNVLFHFYCIILGLSLYSIIYFAIVNFNENFNEWYSESTHTKPIGFLLIAIAVLFYFLWLSQSLPASLTNRVPQSILKDGLFTNPVYVLDYSFILPLLVFSAVGILKKRNSGYLLAPVMLVFGIVTISNIIILRTIFMIKLSENNTSSIIVLTLLLVLCLSFLYLLLRNIRKADGLKNI